ncbi:MAG TPA: hypothetical protein VK656_04260 [Candidatus Acidoferrum sp.]|nr:hypothetical protein [Candidatus Acidoferrum sp.]
MADGTLDTSLAALLWLLVEARVPLVVAAGPSRTGKTTLLEAALDFLPVSVRRHELAGYAEDFAWLPEAAALGWRPHGFRGIGVGQPIAAGAPDGSGAPGALGAPNAAGALRPPTEPVAPSSTVMVASELSDHLPIYTWGEQARIAVRALSLGYGLGATIHAESLEEVFAELGSAEVGLSDDELSRLGVVVILRVVPERGTGRPIRRVVAAHYVRPVSRDTGGHVQHLGPAVLSTWDERTDRFEDFAWGVVPELAERVGRRAGDFEIERERRAAVIATLVRSAVFEAESVRAELLRHALPPASARG